MSQDLDKVINDVHRISELYLVGNSEGDEITASDAIIEIYGAIKHITVETLAKPEWSAKAILRQMGME